MDDTHGRPKRTFTFDEAAAFVPELLRLTTAAESAVAALEGAGNEARVQEVVAGWARDVQALGIEVKGLWLVDFDNGSGYYCWQHPERSLQYYHGYEEGFRGRMRIQ